MSDSDTSTTTEHWHLRTDTAHRLLTALEVMEDPREALDTLAHMVPATTADAEEASAAATIAQRYCTCHPAPASAQQQQALRALRAHQSLCEQLGAGWVEFNFCRDLNCLKYCSRPDCGNYVSIDDPDFRCWVCGASYVPWERCGWLEWALGFFSRRTAMRNFVQPTLSLSSS